MIGAYPTVGCLAFITGTSPSVAKMRVARALGALIVPGSWQQGEQGCEIAEGVLGQSQVTIMTYAQETPTGTYVFVLCDEDRVVQIARDVGMKMECMFNGYINELLTISGCRMVGLGFELSLPATRQDHDLREAGVALVFERISEETQWVRKDLLPAIGHYE